MRAPSLTWVVPDLDARPDARRARKFLALMFILGGVCASTLLMTSVLGVLREAEGSLIILITSALAILAIRWRVPLAAVTAITLCIGSGIVVRVALHVGQDGLSVVLWLSVAPLIALVVGGRSAGRFVLLSSLALMALCLYGISQQWGVDPTRTPNLAVRISTVLFVTITLFMIVQAYDAETERNIATLEKRNAELSSARLEAERANRAKSDFLATMSHEIRTPLNGITGIVSLLQTERDPKRIRHLLVVAQESAEVLLSVISDVLDFSKIESNALTLETVAFSPANEVRAVVELLRPQAVQHQTELTVSVDGDFPQWMRGDPMRFRQIVLNLVSNAVKFTEKGLVRCELRRGSSSGLCFEVIDTGVGMSPEVLSRLFTPFTQADASTTRRFGGTGLGLAIAARLVRAMQGIIDVDSQLASGTRFTLTLPLPIAEAPRASSSAATPRPPLEVLVAEDNAVNQLVIRRLLEQLGHSVTVVTNGQAALEAGAQRRFDLILLDCHMPVMDGYEAAQRLRERGVAVPIHALTAAVSTEDLEHCRRSGMDGLLAKPLRRERLEDLLASIPARST